MSRGFLVEAKVLLLIVLFLGQVTSQDDCTKDLLLIVDTSFSIREKVFNEQVKPFLTKVINDKLLNVGLEGTHVAMMVFSRDVNTKMVFNFDEFKTKDTLSARIAELNWNEVKGDHTRTDTALKIAANTIFPLESPLNHRTNADDIIVIITDGHPHGKATSAQDAINYAQTLKAKKVIIVGVGVGREIAKEKSWRILSSISSPGQTIKASFEGIENILEQLVVKSCKREGFCTCPLINGSAYLRDGESKVLFAWKEPTPTCGANQELSFDGTRTIVNPPLTSPNAFSVGNHSISYAYYLKNGKILTCFVNIKIKACPCPPLNLNTKFVGSGASIGRVSWQMPQPQCGGNLKSITPDVRSGNSFPIGPHMITYVYNVDGTFEVTCKVIFEVKACPCPPLNLGTKFAVPGGSTERVSWQAPQPQCGGNLKSITPDVRSGNSFPIGPHMITYVYSVDGTFDVTCKVIFEVKGTALCRNKAFTSSQECCCGVLHKKQPGFACCGVDYYSKFSHQCCPFANVRQKDESCYGPACKCPSIPFIRKYIKQKDFNTSVTWEIPKPSCPSSLVTVTPLVSPGERFPVGSYKIKYSYQVYGSDNVQCTVLFEVKECKCPYPYLPAMYVKPGDSTMKVNWQEPRPSCSEAVQKILDPHQKPGEAFTIGRHSMPYVYRVNNDFDMVCRVLFEVKGALCHDKGYDVTTQVCCCGNIYTKAPGFTCCDKEYYQSSTKICCANAVVRNKGETCPTM